MSKWFTAGVGQKSNPIYDTWARNKAAAVEWLAERERLYMHHTGVNAPRVLRLHSTPDGAVRAEFEAA